MHSTATVAEAPTTGAMLSPLEVIDKKLMLMTPQPHYDVGIRIENGFKLLPEPAVLAIPQGRKRLMV